jgi:hypothetical protein
LFLVASGVSILRSAARVEWFRLQQCEPATQSRRVVSPIFPHAFARQIDAVIEGGKQGAPGTWLCWINQCPAYRFDSTGFGIDFGSQLLNQLRCLDDSIGGVIKARREESGATSSSIRYQRDTVNHTGFYKLWINERLFYIFSSTTTGSDAVTDQQLLWVGLLVSAVVAAVKPKRSAILRGVRV